MMGGPAPPEGFVSLTEAGAKRAAFLDSHDWLQVHALVIDAGLLTPLENGGVQVEKPPCA